ncbi:MAG: hypothetical protein GX344_03435 [Intrasporangiaceae bacterium]|nr:hypothetical protein [Intrasporangiaceae bacterium]
MARYEGRHAGRSAAPPAPHCTAGDRSPRAWIPRGFTTTSSLFSLSLVAATVAAVVAVPSSQDIPTLTSEQARAALAEENEIGRANQEDTARLLAERIDYGASRSAERARKEAQETETAATVAGSQEQPEDQLATERAEASAEEKVNPALELAAAQENPQAAAQVLMPEFGFTGDGQWQCLVNLWMGESDWRWWVENPSSGAYGIPQSLPADKMATAGDDWRTNPVTQIRWGLEYIKLSYGTPCGAWEFWQAQDPHWY